MSAEQLSTRLSVTMSDHPTATSCIHATRMLHASTLLGCCMHPRYSDAACIHATRMLHASTLLGCCMHPRYSDAATCDGLHGDDGAWVVDEAARKGRHRSLGAPNRVLSVQIGAD